MVQQVGSEWRELEGGLSHVSSVGCCSGADKELKGFFVFDCSECCGRDIRPTRAGVVRQTISTRFDYNHHSKNILARTRRIKVDSEEPRYDWCRRFPRFLVA